MRRDGVVPRDRSRRIRLAGRAPARRAGPGSRRADRRADRRAATRGAAGAAGAPSRANRRRNGSPPRGRRRCGGRPRCPGTAALRPARRAPPRARSRIPSLQQSSPPARCDVPGASVAAAIAATAVAEPGDAGGDPVAPSASATSPVCDRHARPAAGGSPDRGARRAPPSRHHGDLAAAVAPVDREPRADDDDLGVAARTIRGGRSPRLPTTSSTRPRADHHAAAGRSPRTRCQGRSRSAHRRCRSPSAASRSARRPAPPRRRSARSARRRSAPSRVRRPRRPRARRSPSPPAAAARAARVRGSRRRPRPRPRGARCWSAAARRAARPGSAGELHGTRIVQRDGWPAGARNWLSTGSPGGRCLIPLARAHPQRVAARRADQLGSLGQRSAVGLCSVNASRAAGDSSSKHRVQHTTPSRASWHRAPGPAGELGAIAASSSSGSVATRRTRCDR